MRRLNKRNMLDKINKEIIFISSLFMVFVIIGSLLNKFFPQYSDVISEKVSYTANYYNSDVNLKEILISNLKMDLSFLLIMAIGTMTVILSPIAIIVFAIKGLSIGYTINSFIIAMKLSSFKIVLITLIKFVVVLPGMLILALISFKYLFEAIYEIKKKNKSNCVYLMKRYLINSTLIIMGTIFVQTILNALSIVTLQIF
ncbi:stage II sporulation protein M [uncultured Clostridium sp.]|uniref:Stage II sporulation protein M n=1 Tax=Paeniclostridium hominis TaxID=2764329 RepID=A0ABR7K474_9FIRM|nr:MULTISPECIES: hypothetical protein [Paeniclostridium]MDU1538857.1 hypothetical protein [Paeniclostridium sordellii]SCI74760.1 stage II sporulation protein M [uncultured Clostridium sp.]MBC6003912.1 hypothetical protein [Paeniclostridium hominis]MBC8631093.1 hypothetical protein [[Eubacterium] tenue]MDU2592231.1 hypothetical protein [Paeniclostridium sordellii]